MSLNLRERLAVTDRGDLWTAECDGRRSLVRMLDRRVATVGFKRALDQLASVTAHNPAPRLLQIYHHDYSGDNYYIEYLSVSGWLVKSLPVYFSQAGHWLNRLHFVNGITKVYEEWQKTVAPPIGPHAGRVVACKVNGRWLAYLAPCPHIPLASPWDLMPADLEVLLAMPPERLRGVAASGEMEDIFSAGSLVLQALGLHQPIGGLTTHASIEAQARGSNSWDLENSEIEGTLLSVSRTGGLLRTLGEVVRRCTAFADAARPHGILELDNALSAVLVLRSSAAAFAEDLDSRNRLPEALQFVEWVLSLPDESPAEMPTFYSLAANYCARLRMPARELQYVEKFLKLKQTIPMVRRRMELHYDTYLSRTNAAISEISDSDEEGDCLLRDLKNLERCCDPQDPRAEATHREDLMRAAMIYGRRHDLYRRAEVFYRIAQLDAADVEGLFLYCLSLRDLEDRTKDRSTLDAAIRGANQRMANMVKAGVLAEEETKTWMERFQSLRQY